MVKLGCEKKELIYAYVHIYIYIYLANSIYFLNALLFKQNVRCVGTIEGGSLKVGRVKEGIKGFESIMTSDIQAD